MAEHALRIVLRKAEPEDAATIASLVRQNTADHLLNYTIYSHVGYVAFLADRAAVTETSSADRIYVAVADSAVVGVVELACSPEMLFLNHIYVDRSARGRGIGGRLLCYAIRESWRGQRCFELDVSPDNVSASAWYQRLGLRTHSAVQWWHIDGLASPSQGTGAAASYVSDLVQANLMRSRYGFGRATVVTEQARYVVGLMHERLNRITDPRALADSGFLSCWADTWRDCGALLLTTVSAPPAMKASLVAEFHRMRARPEAILESLTGDRDRLVT